MVPSDRTGLEQVVARIAEHVHAEIDHSPRRPVLVCGGIAAGKTVLIRQLADRLREAGVRVGGVFAPRNIARGRTVGYSLVDLATTVSRPFATSRPPGERVGRFFVSEEGLAFARAALRRAIESCDVVIIDEVGRWELKGGGHADSVREALAAELLTILVVRDTLSDAVVRAFGIRGETRFSITPQVPSNVPSEASSELWAIADSVSHPLLITHGADGYPESRPMSLIERDGNRMWFVTSRASRKVRQIDVQPRVSVFFIDTERFNYAAVHGCAAVVNEPALARRVWREEWRDEWPEGPDDPDYVLLRVDGSRGYFYRGYTGESGQIELGAISPPNPRV